MAVHDVDPPGADRPGPTTNLSGLKPKHLITRRRVLTGLAGLGVAAATLGGYAFGVEPMWLRITHYRISPPKWPEGLRLTLAVVVDVHAGEPQMSIGRIEEIVTRTNALGADVILLLGDYEAGHRWLTRRIPARKAAPVWD